MRDRPHPSDPFDPQSLRLPARMVGAVSLSRRPPRHRRGETFLKGPIPWSWWATACRLRGSALQVASAVRFRAGWMGPESIPLGLEEIAGSVGVLVRAGRRGLMELE